MKEFFEILRCPYCSSSLVQQGTSLRCPNAHVFQSDETGAKLPPTTFMDGGDWSLWEEKQHHGEEDYKHPDPQYIAQSDSIARLFGEFCSFRGRILDVGCGIHPRLAYVKDEVYARAFYVGLDPLEGAQRRPYHFVRGIAEQLPFKSGTFDQVILATSLDHFIALDPVLKEVRRVLKQDGTVSIWITVIERIQTKDITLFSWFKDAVYHMTRLRFKTAWKHFLIPFSVAAWDYRSTDQFHFHRFTRRQIQELFSSHGFEDTQSLYIEAPQNPDSKQLFAKFKLASSS